MWQFVFQCNIFKLTSGLFHLCQIPSQKLLSGLFEMLKLKLTQLFQLFHIHILNEQQKKPFAYYYKNSTQTV